MGTLTIEIFKPEILGRTLDKFLLETTRHNRSNGHRAGTVLLRGILWRSLAICVLAALFYGIASWFAGS
jgi:hypothetical protein